MADHRYLVVRVRGALYFAHQRFHMAVRTLPCFGTRVAVKLVAAETTAACSILVKWLSGHADIFWGCTPADDLLAPNVSALT